MNSHYKLKFNLYINKRAANYLSEVQYEPTMIAETDLVVIFALGYGNKTMEGPNVIPMLLQQLISNGLKVKDKIVLNNSKMREFLFRRVLLDNSRGTNKNYFEDLMSEGNKNLQGQNNNLNEFRRGVGVNQQLYKLNTVFF